MNRYNYHQGSIEALELLGPLWEEQKLTVAVGNEVVFDFYKRFDFYPLHIIIQRKQ